MLDAGLRNDGGGMMVVKGMIWVILLALGAWSIQLAGVDFGVWAFAWLKN